MKKCSLSLCISMILILICGMDIEINPGLMQTGHTSFEQKDTRNTKSQEQDSEHGACHKPTKVILEDILLKLEGFNGRFDHIENKPESVVGKMENTIEGQTKIKAENEKLTKQVKDLEEKVSYLEGQSKRNNLLFHGVPEQKDETWNECEVAMRKILEEKLGMEEAWDESDIAIERAHHVGKFTKDKIRPIVVKFANCMHRSLVFMNKSKLQGSTYRIQKQFSDKITQEKRRFQPLIEKAIGKGKHFYVRYKKLLIDDVVYMFDYESNTIKPLKEINKYGVDKATSFRRNINHVVSVSKEISCDNDSSSLKNLQITVWNVSKLPQCNAPNFMVA